MERSQKVSLCNRRLVGMMLKPMDITHVFPCRPGGGRTAKSSGPMWWDCRTPSLAVPRLEISITVPNNSHHAAGLPWEVYREGSQRWPPGERGRKKRGSLFIWAVMHAQSNVLGVGHGAYVKGQTQELHCHLELMCLLAGSGSWL